MEKSVRLSKEYLTNNMYIHFFEYQNKIQQELKNRILKEIDNNRKSQKDNLFLNKDI